MVQPVAEAALPPARAKNVRGRTAARRSLHLRVPWLCVRARIGNVYFHGTFPLYGLKARGGAAVEKRHALKPPTVWRRRYQKPSSFR